MKGWAPLKSSSLVCVLFENTGWERRAGAFINRNRIPWRPKGLTHSALGIIDRLQHDTVFLLCTFTSKSCFFYDGKNVWSFVKAFLCTWKTDTLLMFALLWTKRLMIFSFLNAVLHDVFHEFANNNDEIGHLAHWKESH